MFFTMQERRERLAEKRQHDEERRQWQIRDEEERRQREIRDEEERLRRADHDARMEQLMTRFVEALERIESRNNGNSNGAA